MLDCNQITLPNGVRILTEHVPAVSSAALGIWVNTGSREEKASENGAAHFIEHMLFKGTSRWSAAELAELRSKSDEKAKEDALELASDTENRKAAMRARADARLEKAAALIVERVVNG